MLGSRNISSGKAAAAIARTKINNPTARGIGGNTTHRPAHEKSRKSPITIVSAARAGHNRSQNKLPRARLSARARRNRVGWSGSGRWSFVSSKRRSVAWALGESAHDPDHDNTRRPSQPRVAMRLKPIRHAIERNQLVNFKARPHQRPLRVI